MNTPFRPPTLITPLEPGLARSASVKDTPVRHAVHGGTFGRYEVAVASACGSQHAENEDAHSPVDGSGRLFVVADGVGGGAMAALASRQLVQALHGALDGPRVERARVDQAMLDADRLIAHKIAQLTDVPGAATVVLCAPQNLFASRWLIAWVGDCRAYRIAARPGNTVEALSRDHTFGHLDETPPRGGSPDDPARMVGNGAVTAAGVALRDLAGGELLALCSDGVHKHLAGDDWWRVLQSDRPLAQRCDDLIALARQQGSVDDATVLLVQRCGLVKGALQ
ncbi:MAG: PP2C family serine/threonine-protein phosphatase [Burkholderiaceae bacterium]